MIKITEIKTFAILQRFKTDEGEKMFGGHIYATSFAEADQLARQMGAELDGQLLESICEICGKVESFDPENTDEWDDEIIC